MKSTSRLSAADFLGFKKGLIDTGKRDPFGCLSQYSCFTLVCSGYRGFGSLGLGLGLENGGEL